jgi:hypothetical protein
VHFYIFYNFWLQYYSNYFGILECLKDHIWDYNFCLYLKVKYCVFVKLQVIQGEWILFRSHCMYVQYFTMQSTMKWDLYILGSMRYAFSLLPCLKSHGLVERSWCHIVATTSGKISTWFFESKNLSETCQPSTKATGSQISMNFLIQRKSAQLPSFSQKAVKSWCCKESLSFQSNLNNTSVYCLNSKVHPDVMAVKG